MSSKQAQTTEYNDYVNEFLPPPKKLFDVTCVIGSVYADPNDNRGLSPRMVAYMLIAEHGAEGDFTFPMEGGGLERVFVTQDTEDKS